jgi:Leucine-rich repeat (LRR) protein
MAARVFTRLADALAKPEAARRIELLTLRRGTKLPDFAVFPNLEELAVHARGSSLAAFPRIAGCMKLRSLTFTASDITKVPPDVGDLARLETLVLVGHRKLRKLPDEVGRLTKLKELRIDNNGLRELPEQIGGLSMLDTLIAYGNALTYLPSSLAKLRRLRWLEVQMNLMKKPPSVLVKLKLRHLQTDFDELNRFA